MPETPPTSDTLLPAFALNFDNKGTATPGAFGLQASDMLAFHANRLDYMAKLAVCQDPTTKTKAAVTSKNTSRLALLAKGRQLCKIVRANPNVSDTQRVELGLPPRDAAPTPVPPPATRPLVSVDAYGNLRLVDETTPNRKARPLGAIGAVVLYRVVTAAEAATSAITPENGHYAGLATRPKFAIAVPAGATGKVLQVLALWLNPRGDHGPASAAVSTTIAA